MISADRLLRVIPENGLKKSPLMCLGLRADVFTALVGKMGPNSDLDILVVVPFGVHRRNTARSIYRNLVGVGFAVDIVVVTEEDVERYKDNIGMVIKPALEQGSVLYAR